MVPSPQAPAPSGKVLQFVRAYIQVRLLPHHRIPFLAENNKIAKHMYVPEGNRDLCEESSTGEHR